MLLKPEERYIIPRGTIMKSDTNRCAGIQQSEASIEGAEGGEKRRDTLDYCW